ncbi:MAG TPA: BON domain-containing protein [Alphaproteobacteria bacterium]|nr:BON domain-containing protein [Alphaproteobacteria bacterium]
MNKPFARTMLLPAVLMLAAGALQGCIEAAVGAGAGVGVAAAQERGVKGAVSDTGIRAEINHYWLQKDEKLFINCNLQVHEGRVLVSGAVKDADTRAEAIQLAWKAKGVREVINEIEVTNEGGIGNYARDTAIVTELRSKLLFAKDIQSVNYSIEAVNGVVYMLGVAQNQAELDKALNIARNVNYVRRVVSHVLLKDDPRRFREPTA